MKPRGGVGVFVCSKSEQHWGREPEGSSLSITASAEASWAGDSFVQLGSGGGGRRDALGGSTRVLCCHSAQPC